MHRKLTIEGKYYCTILHSTVSLYNNHIVSLLVKCDLFKLETSCTVILPPKASVLCSMRCFNLYDGGNSFHRGSKIVMNERIRFPGELPPISCCYLLIR